MPKNNVTAREIKVLLFLGRYGPSDTHTIHDRFYKLDRTGKACIRSLRFLQTKGLTHGFLHPYANGDETGGIHCLTPAGAKYAYDATGIHRLRSFPEEPSAHRVLHHRGCGRIQLALTEAAVKRGYPEPDCITEADKNRQVPRNAPAHERFVLVEHFQGPGGEVIACHPDLACRFFVPHTNGTGHDELLFYIEHSRATETVQTEAQKAAGYHCLFTNAHPPVKPSDPRPVYRKHWPDLRSPNLITRVLFITTKEQRICQLTEAIRSQKLPGADFWRFTTEAELTRPDFALTDRIWRTVANEPPEQRRGIIKAPAPPKVILPAPQPNACAAAVPASSLPPCPEGQGSEIGLSQHH